MSHNSELLPWVQLSLTERWPQEILRMLADSPERISEINSMNVSELRELGFKASEAELFVSARAYETAHNVIETCNDKGIQIIPMSSPEYPSLLKDIADPSPALYVKGRLPDFESVLSVAVVGQRECTSQALSFAEKLGSDLAEWGIILISGGADGIDAAAMRGALRQGGTVVGVLGNGPDIEYPAKNGGLLRKTADYGCLLSEYVPGTRPKQWFFPLRNRIISALSRGVVVVEARKKSGSLHTAHYAMEQGKELFAVPGTAAAEYCAGSNEFLREGAVFCEGIEDILTYYSSRYNLSVTEKEENKDLHAEPAENNSVPVPSGLPNTEALVLSSIGSLPVTTDTIINKCGLSPQDVLSALTMLQIRGLVRALPGDIYTRS